MRNLLLGLAVLGAGGAFGAKLYVQHKAEQDLDALLEQARPFVDVEYERVVATIRGELRAEDVTVRLPQFDDPVVIDSVGVLTPGFLFLLGFDRRELALPEFLGLEVTGLRARPDADFMQTFDELHEAQIANLELTPADHCAGTYGLTPAALKRLGYGEIVVDFNASFRTVDGRLVMELGADVENMYAFDVELTLDGVTNPAAMARGTRPLLVGARLDYFDRSLNGRIAKHCAAEQVAHDDVIAAQLREIENIARQQGVELDAPLMEPYTDFLLGKERFTLTAAPPKPVDLTRVSLYKPSDVPNLLNLMAESG